jgi:hypothetical protein
MANEAAILALIGELRAERDSLFAWQKNALAEIGKIQQAVNGLPQAREGKPIGDVVVELVAELKRQSEPKTGVVLRPELAQALQEGNGQRE